MATASTYRAGNLAFVNKELDWDTDAFSAMLLSNTYAIDTDTQVYVADISGDEISGGSYVRKALTGKGYATAAGTVKLLADDIVFAALTASNVRYMVVFRNTGSDATAKLVAVVEFTADINPVAAPVTFNLSTDGLVNLVG